jgi:hypothetical protein
VYVIEVDTSSNPQTVVLSGNVTGYTIIKDISGNASANNITLTGTVDATVNPVINTDYGIYHVYQSVNDNNFYTW